MAKYFKSRQKPYLKFSAAFTVSFVPKVMSQKINAGQITLRKLNKSI
jgi:hypothetical protein